MSDFLQLDDEQLINDFNINAQPEYYMSEMQVAELIKSGSYEAFLDCLDYAPTGVIDLVKRLAVSLPMNDMKKAEALKDKTGFDLEAALKNIKAEKEDEEQNVQNEEKEEKRTAQKSFRRRTDANYKVVEKPATPEYKIVSK